MTSSRKRNVSGCDSVPRGIQKIKRQKGKKLRRNHAAQYISHPDWPWHRLRDETPGRYESYVDIEPGKWIRIRIEVRGDRARLYVNGNAQPTLIVNDLKSGPQGRGAIALWIDSETIAHFRDLRVHSD